MKPKILLCHSVGKEQFYIDAINGAGGEAVAKYCPALSIDYDGLVLGGGNDISPARYGEEINGSVDIDYNRDEAEFLLAKAFLDAKKPILGICRGYQLLNVLLGGSLIQHIDCVELHRKGEDDLVHELSLKDGSVLKNLYGKEKIFVNSFHHQAIKEVGKGLDITASIGDIPEAFQHESLPVFGVQFHPERMCLAKKRDDAVDGMEIFKHFIDLCKTKN